MRDQDHAAHHPSATTSPADRVDKQMKMMQAMHQKMAAAKTPEERQALMTEHMKAMQGGMSMMCEMGTGGTGMAGGAGSNDMMKRCMDMRNMTMQMMMDREAVRAPAGK
ncbi:MAG TPA: hypothetical protein VLJ86_20825 [Ramlibacter sp.]|nr:hypothetical protein [Ramlibacter sp.]